MNPTNSDAPATKPSLEAPQIESGHGVVLALLLGVVVALLAMTFAWRLIGWPAPGVSVALGYAIYRLARRVGPGGDQ